MHEKYLALFKEIIKASEILAEQVAEYNHNNHDDKGTETAEFMKKDFAELGDRLEKPDYKITLQDYTKIFVGSYIIANNLQTKIKNEQLALDGYNNDLIPKLKRITTEAKTDDEAATLANEIFQIKEKSNN